MKNLSLLLGLVIGTSLYAQITINLDDIPLSVSDSFVVKSDTEFIRDVDVHPGGPITWYFDTTFIGEYDTGTIILPTDAPNHSDFPEADRVYKEWSYNDDNYIVGYFFLSYDASHIYGLGTVAMSQDSFVSVPYEPPSLEYIFPLTYGTTWSSEYSTEYEIDSVTTTYVKYREHHTIDAWGTLELPTGSYSALRERLVDTVIASYVVNDDTLFTDTTIDIHFFWLTKDYGNLVTIDGDLRDLVGDTLHWALLSVITYLNVHGVEELPVNTKPTLSIKVTPNPVNFSSVLSVNVPPGVPFTLSFYDRQGRLINRRTFGISHKNRLIMDLKSFVGKRSLASGVYFVGLETPRTVLKEKILILR